MYLFCDDCIIPFIKEKKGQNEMKHAYLSEVTISEALSNRVITTQEADKLKKKIDTQVSIFKTINK